MSSPTREQFRFPRSHRLKKRRLIRPLFDRGSSDVATLTVGVIRILYRIVEPAPDGTLIQIGFTSSGVRGAVKRNRIKRLLREGYRLNQSVLRTVLSGGDTEKKGSSLRAGGLVEEDRIDNHPRGMLTCMIMYRGRPEEEDRIPPDLESAIGRLAASIINRSEA